MENMQNNTPNPQAAQNGQGTAPPAQGTQPAQPMQNGQPVQNAQNGQPVQNPQTAKTPEQAAPSAGQPQNTGSPYARAPYTGQNPYSAQNPNAAQQPQNTGYANRPPYGAQNPYTQNTGYANRPPYSAQNPYGQRPPYGAPNPQNPRPPYGQGQPPYGYAPPTPNTKVYMSPQKLRDQTQIRRISNATGLAVIAFTALPFLISFALTLIPGFFEVYETNSIFYICFNALYSTVVIGVPFYCVYRFLRKRQALGELNLGTPAHGGVTALLVFAALMCCMVGNYATNFFSMFVESIFGIRFISPTDDFAITGGATFLLRILQTAVLPALIEEFAVRGVVMQPLRRYGDKFALLMSAFVFALMHGNMVQIPFAFIAGLAIGYAVIATGSMWTGVIIHFCNNLIAVCSEAAYDLLPEEAAALITLAMMALVFVVGLVCAIVYAKRYARVPLTKTKTQLDTREKNRAFLCSAPMIIAIVLLVLETIQYVEF